MIFAHVPIQVLSLLSELDSGLSTKGQVRLVVIEKKKKSIFPVFFSQKRDKKVVLVDIGWTWLFNQILHLPYNMIE